MRRQLNSIPITGIARTITDLAGICAPENAAASIDIICNCAKEFFGSKKIDRVFMYNPDAIAMWLFQKHTALFEKTLISSDIQLPMLSVMPTVTPVCFASMYTGTMPDLHGIKAYEKPVLKADTIFDAYIRAGLKPAIVSTVNDSISCIFLERNMDYYICYTHEECNTKALELIEEDNHDLIVLYNGNYDAAMHRTGPESFEAMNELKECIEMYRLLIEHIKLHWSAHRTFTGFCTDHGCHEIDRSLGSHGLEMAEDLNVVHFFRFI